jgi:hypothetical protein
LSSSVLSGLELKAVISQPHALSSLMAIWPKPPMPITPT